MFPSRRELHPVVKEYLGSFQESPTVNPLLEELRFVVIDTETTGLNHRKDRLLSIGAVALHNNRIAIDDSFEALINNDITEKGLESIRVHGILPERLKTEREEKEVILSFLKYLKNDVFVAHHAGFDLKMINRSLKKHFGIRLQNKVLDTAVFAARLDHGLKTDEIRRSDYNLDTLALRYHIPTHERHTAPGDAFITARILLFLLSGARKRGMKTQRDLFRR